MRTQPKVTQAYMFKAIRATGYELSIRVDDMDTIDITALRQHVAQQRDKIWEGLDICPRTCPFEKSRRCTYARWFARPPDKHARSLLDVPISASCMKGLLRFVWAVIACREMKAHGLGPAFLGWKGSAISVQQVQWVMRKISSLSVQNCNVSGSSGLTYLRGHKQCWLSCGKMILLLLPILSMLAYVRWKAHRKGCSQTPVAFEALHVGKRMETAFKQWVMAWMRG